MKVILFMLAILSASVSAQEDWGPAEFIWGDWGGACYRTEPCFGRVSSEIIITFRTDYNIGYRIMDIDMNSIMPESLSVAGYNDISPYIASDLSTLYFSSDRPGGFGGFDIWKSEYIDENWTLPENLGQGINTAEDETGPTLNYLQDELFFHRGSYYIEDCIIYGHVFISVLDGEWQPAIPAPEPIRSDYNEFKPSLYSGGEKLYFVSDRPNGLEIGSAVWVSYREQGIWQNPQLLIGQVNEIIISPPFCEQYDVLSVAVEDDGFELLFNKSGICDFDPEGRVYLSFIPTDISDSETPKPEEFLLTAYPNPFNARTTISFSLPVPGDVSLIVYDLLGRHVRNIVDEFKQAGKHHVLFDSVDLKSGIYFYSLRSGGSVYTKRLVLLK